MKSSGTPGSVHISDSTAQLLYRRPGVKGAASPIAGEPAWGAGAPPSAPHTDMSLVRVLGFGVRALAPMPMKGKGMMDSFVLVPNTTSNMPAPTTLDASAFKIPKVRQARCRALGGPGEEAAGRRQSHVAAAARALRFATRCSRCQRTALTSRR